MEVSSAASTLFSMPSGKRVKAKRREERAYKEALVTQLRYIHRSCELFDQGYWDEAIRIATQLRVILSPGGGSKKSLLQHLGVNRNVKLLSTCGPVSPNAVMYQGMGSFEYRSDGVTQTSKFYAPLDDTPLAYEMKLHEWWEQVVYVLPPPIPSEGPVPPALADEPSTVLQRKSIILTAANKDGGAHIDAELTPEYERLAAPGAVGEWVGVVDGVEQRTPIIGAHFVCLRQMGYEILRSPGLGALLGEPVDQSA